jgi:hypothetical protein
MTVPTLLEASSTAQPAGRNRSQARGGIRLDCQADERTIPTATGWDILLGAVISDNVSAVNEPARADRQGGEAGSRPFPSYPSHGPPGQRAKRASVNPAC